MEAEDIQSILILIGVICVLTVIVMFSYKYGATETLVHKCAETQGKYDFCVQKISYEVKK